MNEQQKANGCRQGCSICHADPPRIAACLADSLSIRPEYRRRQDPAGSSNIPDLPVFVFVEQEMISTRIDGRAGLLLRPRPPGSMRMQLDLAGMLGVSRKANKWGRFGMLASQMYLFLFVGRLFLLHLMAQRRRQGGRNRSGGPLRTRVGLQNVRTIPCTLLMKGVLSLALAAADRYTH